MWYVAFVHFVPIILVAVVSEPYIVAIGFSVCKHFAFVSYQFRDIAFNNYYLHSRIV